MDTDQDVQQTKVGGTMVAIHTALIEKRDHRYHDHS